MKPSSKDSKTLLSKQQHAVEMIIANWWNDYKVESFVKANTKQQLPLPDHNYSHKEGNSATAKHYFTDSKGNFVRYTNAPQDHVDHSKYSGDSQVHPSEPTFEKNPEFYTTDGRKLSRAPQSVVEWNPSYHPQDVKNLWAGRWVNPETGKHEYTYLDQDIRTNPQLLIHRITALTDIRLPYLRQYVWDLFRSPQIKDLVMGLMLALLDQGRMSALELASLTPSQVAVKGDLVLLGSRIIHADPKISMIIKVLCDNPDPNAYLFAVPVVGIEGQYDVTKMRHIGPNLLAQVLDFLGLSLEGLMAYHANQLFSLEVERAIFEQRLPFEQAMQHALVEVGNDINQDPQMFIDPVIIEALKRNAVSMQTSMPLPTTPMSYPSVPYVTTELTNKTGAEQQFSNFLHTVPVHEYLV